MKTAEEILKSKVEKVFIFGHSVSIVEIKEYQQLILDAMEEYASQFKQEWISVRDRTPDFVKDKDYSENVWATDGDRVFVMAYCYVANEGFFWANCNMVVDGEAEFDDDYGITHWMPLYVPKPPKNNP